MYIIPPQSCCCGHPEDMFPHPKSKSDVKTNDATHSKKVWKIFVIHITWLSGGGRAGFPSWSEKCLESTERRLRFFLWLGGGTGVKVFFHGQGLATPTGTKERRSFWISYQLSQM